MTHRSSGVGRRAAPPPAGRFPPLAGNAARRIEEQAPDECAGAAGLPREAHELEDLSSVGLAEQSRIQVEQGSRQALGRRHHETTFLARADASSVAIRALSAASTREPSRVIR